MGLAVDDLWALAADAIGSGLWRSNYFAEEDQRGAAPHLLDGSGKVAQWFRRIRAVRKDGCEHGELAATDGEREFENLAGHGDFVGADVFDLFAKDGSSEHDYRIRT